MGEPNTVAVGTLSTSPIRSVLPDGGISAADAAALVPFAEVDEVAEEGPAAASGILLGDQLLRFGNLTASNHDNLRGLARLTQRSVGSSIPLLVLRGGDGGGTQRLALELQPRRWAGNGLLGCHLKPL